MIQPIHGHIPFKPASTAILLVDHQPGVLAMTRSVPADQVTQNVAVLARLGEQLGIPLVITSTRETIEFLGTNLPAIQQGAPRAYAARIRRAGMLDAFADPKFVDALKKTGRSNLVIAGLLTDVCLMHTVISALQARYQVQVVADASGTSSVLADSGSYERMHDLGAVATSTYGILFELFPDLSTQEGQRAEAIAADSAREQ